MSDFDTITDLRLRVLELALEAHTHTNLNMGRESVTETAEAFLEFLQTGKASLEQKDDSNAQ